VYLTCLWIQVVFYAMAAAGRVMQLAGGRLRALAAPWLFVSLNITTVLALWDAVRGRYTVTWERAAAPKG
jgi:hypothetical protein